MASRKPAPKKTKKKVAPVPSSTPPPPLHPDESLINTLVLPAGMGKFRFNIAYDMDTGSLFFRGLFSRDDYHWDICEGIVYGELSKKPGTSWKGHTMSLERDRVNDLQFGYSPTGQALREAIIAFATKELKLRGTETEPAKPATKRRSSPSKTSP
jgi:hypothetical protein